MAAPGQMLDDTLALPDHLRDALWRVESARLESADSTGVIVCGMGGSAIGGDLAGAAFGRRLARPMTTVRAYELPSWVGDDWTVICSSYSGNTEETLACFDAATALGARRVVVGTGGALVDRAREDGVPVVGLPGILQPRAAVAYMFVTAAEIAATSGAGPSLRAEIEEAADFLSARIDALRGRAAEVAGRIEGTLPVVCGADLTASVAHRWKTQINENAKAQAFYSELPEADHNEICGWAGAPEGTHLSAVLLEDADQGERVRLRFRLTAEAIVDAGCEVVTLESEGPSRVARMLDATLLGDLVSLELAEARGVDPLSIDAIEKLKSALERS